jgi:SEC-C motif-containing protein
MTTDPQSLASVACPCGRGVGYDECCGPFHRGAAAAPTAERLMRSRYCAFALGDAGYLLRTWHRQTRPAQLVLPTGDRWLGLTVLASSGGGLLDAEGTVEFVARVERANPSGPTRVSRQREVSRFRREQNEWRYLDGGS